MPSHKTLKSVVRSIAESFTSLMNYIENDYVMGHIIRTAWETGATGFKVDLLSGQTDSSPLLVKPVVESVQFYVKRFPDLVIRSGSSLDFIKSAELILTVEPHKKRPHGIAKYQESPFDCTVNIEDDRDKLYSHTIKGWWYPE